MSDGVLTLDDPDLAPEFFVSGSGLSGEARRVQRALLEWSKREGRGGGLLNGKAETGGDPYIKVDGEVREITDYGVTDDGAVRVRYSDPTAFDPDRNQSTRETVTEENVPIDGGDVRGTPSDQPAGGSEGPAGLLDGVDRKAIAWALGLGMVLVVVGWS